jgi:uncharacterized protein
VLYADSSALIKRYLEERGTKKLNAKIDKTTSAFHSVLTSVLSYAEIHAALARKLNDRTLRATEYHGAATRFDSDWKTYLTTVELSPVVLALVPDLVKRHPLKGSDAVHLASAIWVRQSVRLGKTQKSLLESLVFATSDKQLGRAAEKEQLQVYGPEAAG